MLSNYSGNTCYANATIQSLAHVRQVVQLFGTGTALALTSSIAQFGNPGALVREFTTVIMDLIDSTLASGPISPAQIFRPLPEFSLASQQQEDSLEFLEVVLGHLNTELLQEEPKDDDFQWFKLTSARDAVDQAMVLRAIRTPLPVLDQFRYASRELAKCGNSSCGAVSIIHW